MTLWTAKTGIRMPLQCRLIYRAAKWHHVTLQPAIIADENLSQSHLGLAELSVFGRSC